MVGFPTNVNAHILDSAKLLPWLKPYPPDQMEFYQVDKIVNSPANDVANCAVPMG
jgi:hypothetical protein